MVEFKTIEVSGVIREAARDLDGSVLAVNIHLANGEIFLADDTKKSNELLSLIGHFIRVSGKLRLDGQLSIFEVLDIKTSSQRASTAPPL